MPIRYLSKESFTCPQKNNKESSVALIMLKTNSFKPDVNSIPNSVDFVVAVFSDNMLVHNNLLNHGTAGPFLPITRGR